MNTIYSFPIRKRYENLNSRQRNDVILTVFWFLRYSFGTITLSGFLIHYIYETGPITFIK
jgi:hypothetical protein